MRRFITVEIDINDEIDGSCLFRDYVFSNPDKFIIEIRRDSEFMGSQHSMIAFAHECGHMIASIFRLPGYMNDFRSYIHDRPLKISCQDGMIQSEKEAWNLAALMLDFERQKRNYLSTYEPRVIFDPVKFYEEIK